MILLTYKGRKRPIDLLYTVVYGDEAYFIAVDGGAKRLKILTFASSKIEEAKVVKGQSLARKYVAGLKKPGYVLLWPNSPKLARVGPISVPEAAVSRYLEAGWSKKPVRLLIFDHQ
jgi:hypothetical protein